MRRLRGRDLVLDQAADELEARLVTPWQSDVTCAQRRRALTQANDVRRPCESAAECRHEDSTSWPDANQSAASAMATGIEADDMLPFLSRLVNVRSREISSRLATASMMRGLA